MGLHSAGKTQTWPRELSAWANWSWKCLSGSQSPYTKIWIFHKSNAFQLFLRLSHLLNWSVSEWIEHVLRCAACLVLVLLDLLLEAHWSVEASWCWCWTVCLAFQDETLAWFHALSVTIWSVHTHFWRRTWSLWSSVALANSTWSIQATLAISALIVATVVIVVRCHLLVAVSLQCAPVLDTKVTGLWVEAWWDPPRCLRHPYLISSSSTFLSNYMAWALVLAWFRPVHHLKRGALPTAALWTYSDLVANRVCRVGQVLSHGHWHFGRNLLR